MLCQKWYKSCLDFVVVSEMVQIMARLCCCVRNGTNHVWTLLLSQKWYKSWLDFVVMSEMA